MKIIVLHGEDEISARSRLFSFIEEAKRRNWLVERIKDGDSILEKLKLESLYFPNLLLILENYRALDKDAVKFLGANLGNMDKVLVICSFGKVIPQSDLRKFPKSTRIEKFDYPKVMYDLWNNILPNNSQRILTLLREALKANPPELVFHSFFKRIRDLYWIKISPSTIPYGSRQVYWLERQASHFTQEDLRRILNFLAEVDTEAKMSTLGIDFYLDLVVFKYLK